MAPLPQNQPVGGTPPAVVTAPGRIQWARALPLAGLTGAMAGVLSVIPFVSLGCCLWMLGAGALTVVLYRERTQSDVSTGMGFRLGASTGLLGYLVYVFFFGLLQVMRGRQFRSAFRQQLEQAAAANPDPNVRQMIERMSTPEGIAIVVTIMLAIFLLVFILFSAAGGALGGSLFGRREPR